jgi:excisionase family DNA binding protein
MASTLVRDAEALETALAEGGEEVHVALSRGTAEAVARWVSAQARGQQIVVSHGLREVSPAEAAKLMGMSRAQVRKLLDAGRLPFRLVGTHYRIPAAAVDEFMAAERAHSRVALAELMALQNELGLTE